MMGRSIKNKRHCHLRKVDISMFFHCVTFFLTVRSFVNALKIPLFSVAPPVHGFSLLSKFYLVYHRFIEPTVT